MEKANIEFILPFWHAYIGEMEQRILQISRSAIDTNSLGSIEFGGSLLECRRDNRHTVADIPCSLKQFVPIAFSTSGGVSKFNVFKSDGGDQQRPTSVLLVSSYEADLY
jgi:hypothetical protein